MSPHDWRAEYAALSERDRSAGGLPPEGLERLSVAAFLLGRDAESTGLRERAYHSYLSRGDIPAAVRCAFWLGFQLQNRGEYARSSGWLSMQQRLVTATGPGAFDEQFAGLTVLAQAATRMAAQDPLGAKSLFEQAAGIAENVGDLDAFVLAGLGRVRCLEMAGLPFDAAATDEVMVHVLGGSVAAQLVGFAYCSTIALCLRHFDVRRAQEWTRALTGWCDSQSGLVPYRGACLVYRAELLQVTGDWTRAVEAAQDACRQLTDSAAEGSAHYRLAELHRLQGNFVRADPEYSLASALGAEVQPGLARLRAAQGKPGAAMAGLDRALGEGPRSPARPAIQAARIEIALLVGDLAVAREASADLEQLAAEPCAPYLKALAAHGAGAVLVAAGDPSGAVPRLRQAQLWWQQVNAPYEVARCRALVATACRALGDDDAARMERDAARAVFARLGAAVDSLPAGGSVGRPGDQRLTARECEVLRLVATGVTNKVIAERLMLSDKTVARHLSNIFGKLGVTSRAAATAYAYEHQLV